MTKQDRIKKYSIIELTKEDVKLALFDYIENSNSIVSTDSSLVFNEDGTVTVEVIWYDGKKDSL